MKTKVLTSVCTVMMLLPAAIFPLRPIFERYAAAAAPVCAVIFILCGIFTACVFFKSDMKSDLLRLCLIVNVMYAVFAFVLLVMILAERVFP